MWLSSRKERLNKSNLTTLFLVCVFPFHLWTIILVMKDLNWIASRTNLGDAIGVGAYAMLYAFLESGFFFLLMAALYFSLPGKWKGSKALALSGIIALWIPLLAGGRQVYRYYDHASPGFVVEALFATGHPRRILVIVIPILVGIVFGSLLIPSYLVVFKDRTDEKVTGALERIGTLSILYLLMDVVGLVIVVIRNLS